MRTKSKAIPIRPRRSKAASKPPAKPALPSREELIAKIGTAFEVVEEIMSNRPMPRQSSGGTWVDGSVSFGFAHHGDPLHHIVPKLKALGSQLDEVLRGYPHSPDRPGLDDAILEHFGTKPGEPLAWTRPGAALLWVGEIPVRATWGGFFDLGSSGLFAVDERKLFISDSGYRSVNTYGIPNSARTPEDLLRKQLLAVITPDRYSPSHGQLSQLVQRARASVVAFLAEPENAWWIQAIQQSPVDPIPLPATIRPVQTTLFS